MKLLSFSVILPRLFTTYVIFHDFRELEDGLTKLHDVP